MHILRMKTVSMLCFSPSWCHCRVKFHHPDSFANAFQSLVSMPANTFVQCVGERSPCCAVKGQSHTHQSSQGVASPFSQAVGQQLPKLSQRTTMGSLRGLVGEAQQDKVTHFYTPLQVCCSFQSQHCGKHFLLWFSAVTFLNEIATDGYPRKMI